MEALRAETANLQEQLGEGMAAQTLLQAQLTSAQVGWGCSTPLWPIVPQKHNRNRNRNLFRTGVYEV